MNATMARGAYELGETLAVVANVNNSSTKDIQPKYTLKQVVVYRAGGKQISSKKILMKASANVIEPNTQKSVTCSMQIPADMPPSIGNCRILSVEYFLKVRLNIKFSFDPKIKFPVVIMPSGSIAIHQSGGAVGPYPPGTMVGHQSTGLFHHPPSTFLAPYPAHYCLSAATANLPISSGQRPPSSCIHEHLTIPITTTIRSYFPTWPTSLEQV
ncbi:hypothetical protein NHX12_029335 [Muraenolepis orangiensis]|uniref:Arrestin C-terminal-like domain-containing protein n=1 Tax=Muraenolepis orangiensis TaxID=630683 RepID=A0A9Q0EFU5_9TELE|nr:hypothetical protein NHX12_029335 [Muraenolepis orangiensis]